MSGLTSCAWCGTLIDSRHSLCHECAEEEKDRLVKQNIKLKMLLELTYKHVKRDCSTCRYGTLSNGCRRKYAAPEPGCWEWKYYKDLKETRLSAKPFSNIDEDND